MSLKRRNKVPFTVYFTEKQMKWMKAQRTKNGFSVAEVARIAVNRLIDHALPRDKMVPWLAEK